PAPPPQEPPRRQDEEDFEEVEDDEDEAPRPRKARRKKKRSSGGKINATHVALVVVGLVVVLAVTGILFLLQRGDRAKPKLDPQQVLTELQQLGARVERDEKSPEKPVIGVTLTGTEFPADLLGRLAAFPQLQKVNLGHTKTTDVILEHLEDVTTLRVLNLN